GPTHARASNDWPNREEEFMRPLLSLVASSFLLSTAASVFAQTTAPPPEPASTTTTTSEPAQTQPAPPVSPPPVQPPAAPKPPPPSPAAAAPSGMAAFLAKFSATLYGYIALYTIADSTQSFNEGAGNGNVVAAGYGHEHGRVMFSAR